MNLVIDGLRGQVTIPLGFGDSIGRTGDEFVVRNPQTGKDIRVSQADIPACLIPTVSQRHTEVILTDWCSITIRDMHSTNGTFHNDEKADCFTAYRGDTVQFGYVKARVA